MFQKKEREQTTKNGIRVTIRERKGFACKEKMFKKGIPQKTRQKDVLALLGAQAGEGSPR